MSNRMAVIITGQLRAIDENKKYLDAIALLFDVFICTSRDSTNDLGKLINVKQVFFIDDNAEEREEERRLLLIAEGSKLLQWQKLRYAVKIIEKYEDQNNFQYDQFIKLRSDLVFTDEFIEEIKKFNANDNTIYMYTDLYFGAKRKEFLILSSFYEFRDLYYSNFLLDSIDLTNFYAHNLSSAKFLWLQYERSIFKKIIYFIKNRDEYNDEVARSFIEGLERLKLATKIDLKMCSRPSWDSILFASESLFLHFILSKKLIVQPLTKLPITIFNNRFFDVKLFLSNYNSMNYLAINYSLNTIDKNKRMISFKEMCLLGSRASKVKLVIMLLYFLFTNFKYINFIAKPLLEKVILKIKSVF